jgi:nucleoside-diphosphate-sugar epimerase
LALARSALGGEVFLIAVTGASGYIGAHCVAEALKLGRKVVAVSTQPMNKTLRSQADRLKWQFVGDRYGLDERDWTLRFEGVDTVIHCAARVHQTDRDAKKKMHYDNALVTEAIANAASQANVKRFIFLSSAAVYGEHTNLSAYPISALLNGASEYAVSKIEAEQKLADSAITLGGQMHILRPPVVYGVGARGNMARLALTVAKGVPLPFGAIDNRRSIVSIRTLVNAIFWCIDREGPTGISIWNVADRAPLSTTQIVNAIARGVVRSGQSAPRNLALPSSLVRAALTLVGQRKMAHQLLDSWELDVSELVNAGFDGFFESEVELELLGRSM